MISKLDKLYNLEHCNSEKMFTVKPPRSRRANLEARPNY